MVPDGVDQLRQLFEQLDSWRHLPAYRLESRADVFFGLYIRGVVEKCIGQALHPVVIPELPLRRGTLYGDEVKGSNASVKVDYALFAQDRGRAYFVELKTDQNSRRGEQDDYLMVAKDLGMAPIVKGILKIMDATDTSYRPKYMHLLARLERLGFIEVPPDTYTLSRPAAWREIRVSSRAEKARVEVLYVQPKSDGSQNVIDFEHFGNALPQGDPVAELFREYLLRWRAPAGASPP